MTEDKETLDGESNGSGRRRNMNWVNGEGTVQKEEPGQYGEVPAGLRGETLRLDANAECEKVEIRERPVGETGDSNGAPGFTLLASRANSRGRRRGATCPERLRPSYPSGRQSAW